MIKHVHVMKVKMQSQKQFSKKLTTLKIQQTNKKRNINQRYKCTNVPATCLSESWTHHLCLD